LTASTYCNKAAFSVRADQHRTNADGKHYKSQSIPSAILLKNATLSLDYCDKTIRSLQCVRKIPQFPTNGVH